MLVTPIRNNLITRALMLFFFLIVTFILLYFGSENASKKKRNNLAYPSIYTDEDSIEYQPVFPITVKKLSTLSTTIKPSVSSEEVHEEWALDNENIPHLSVVLKNRSSGPHSFNKVCAKYPDLYTIRFNNVHWQVQDTAIEDYYLYSAYLDTRGKISSHRRHPYDNATVRILVMSELFYMSYKNSTMKYCQFWFERKPEPKFGKVTLFKMIWNPKWGKSGAHYFPYLISCDLPPGLKELPVSVSLVPTQCTNATNNLGILHRNRNLSELKHNPIKNFAVCVKSLDLPNKKSLGRLVEWIETIRVLGADKIFFYEHFVHPKIKKLLDYYESREIIGVAQTSLPGELPNQAQLRHLYIREKVLDKRMTELIPYNDCLLRHMYDYKYIVLIDTDEIIMPLNQLNWKDMLARVKKVDIKESEIFRVTSICFRNYYFMDKMLDGKENQVSDISKNFHMLQHVFRSKNHTDKGFMKCFHSTKEALAVHNHFTHFCKDRKRCVRHFVNSEMAQLNHYRSTCVRDIKNCTKYMQETEMDTKIWRFKDQIINRVTNVLRDIEK